MRKLGVAATSLGLIVVLAGIVIRYAASAETGYWVMSAGAIVVLVTGAVTYVSRTMPDK